MIPCIHLDKVCYQNNLGLEFDYCWWLIICEKVKEWKSMFWFLRPSHYGAKAFGLVTSIKHWHWIHQCIQLKLCITLLLLKLSSDPKVNGICSRWSVMGMLMFTVHSVYVRDALFVTDLILTRAALFEAVTTCRYLDIVPQRPVDVTE